MMDIEIHDGGWSYLLKFIVYVKAKKITQATTPVHSHW